MSVEEKLREFIVEYECAGKMHRVARQAYSEYAAMEKFHSDHPACRVRKCWDAE